MYLKQAVHLLEKILGGHKYTRRDFAQWLKDNEYSHDKNTITRILKYIDKNFGFSVRAKRSRYAEDNYFYIDWDASEPDALKDYNFAKSLLINRLLQDVLNERLDLDEYISVSNYTRNQGLEYFPDLFRAVVGRHPVRLRYRSFSAGTEKEYFIEPVLLREYLNRWYVISQNTGKDEKASPIFALDRILDMEVLWRRTFEKDPDKDFAAVFRHVIGVSLYGKEEEVLLRVSPQQSFFFKTLPFHATQELVDVDEEGYHTFKYRLRTNFELGQWIHHYSPHVEVLAPDYLRERIHEEAKEMAKVNKI